MDKIKNITIDGNTAAASMTPAANESTTSANLCDRFLNANPIAAPITVAPPTPSAVNKTVSID